LQYIGQWCRNYKKFDYPPYIRDLKEKDTGQYDTEMEMEMLDDIFWLLPAAVFTQVGNYCDYFFLYGEQNDYVLRAKKLGLKMIYTPKAKIWHYQHLSVTDDDQKSQRIAYWTYFGVLLLVYLHLSVLDFFKFYTVNFIKLVVKSIIQFGSTKQKTVSQPMLYAYFYFTIWLFNKKPNKGFNPYSNIR
jgi:GT2 family glycosyltransferase